MRDFHDSPRSSKATTFSLSPHKPIGAALPRLEPLLELTWRPRHSSVFRIFPRICVPVHTVHTAGTIPSAMLPISYIIMYNPVSSAGMTMCIESALDTFHKPIFKVNLFVFAGQIINSATRPTRTCPTSHSSHLTPHNFIFQSVRTVLRFYRTSSSSPPTITSRSSPLRDRPTATTCVGPGGSIPDSANGSVSVKVCPG